MEQASKAARSIPPEALATQPAWLELLPDIKATGDVRVMRDAYGTRFGVIAGFSYPGGVDPSVYLFDIDASGLIGLAGAGVFDDVAQAAAAWREEVGVSAEGLTPVPATGSPCRGTARSTTTSTSSRWPRRLPTGTRNGTAGRGSS